jgi:type III secretion protein J
MFKNVTLIFALVLASCSLNLQNDLQEDDANEIYVLLQKRGIDAAKIKEGEGKDARYVISVPKADVATAAELLREYSLPRPQFGGLGVFKQMKGMIPTQVEERAMFIEAIGGEVSNALNRIPGVLESRTIVMIPETNDLTQPEKKPKPTASVLIKYMMVDGKPPISIEDVQGFVANSVPEMDKERVKVLLTEAKFVKDDNANEEVQFKTFLGVKVHSNSVGTFKMLIGVFILLFIGAAGVAMFFVIRKPASRPGPRSKTQDN